MRHSTHDQEVTEMKMISQWILSITVSTMTLLWIGGASAQTDDQTSRNHHNEIILSAASTFEDMADAALSADQAGVRRALLAYDQQTGKVGKALSQEKSRVLKAHVEEITKAARSEDYTVVALEAPEAYRILIDSLDSMKMKIPREVSLLDYAGFKLRALANAKPGDWKKAQEVAAEAQANWSAIRSRVADKKLREAVDITVEGMKKASVSQNSEMMSFAAQVDLAIIDLLETHFEKNIRK